MVGPRCWKLNRQFRGKKPTIGTKNISGSGIRRHTKGPTGKASWELSDPSAIQEHAESDDVCAHSADRAVAAGFRTLPCDWGIVRLHRGGLKVET